VGGHLPIPRSHAGDGPRAANVRTDSCKRPDDRWGVLLTLSAGEPVETPQISPDGEQSPANETSHQINALKEE
jgi:hypothetical protein